MDEAMLNALLKTYGAPNTVGNANRVREFGAANPEVLEKRAMGMRGSALDDNSDILGLQLDKLMKASSTDEQLNAATDRGTWPTAQTNMKPQAQPVPKPAGAVASQNKTYPNPQEDRGKPLQTSGIPGDNNAPTSSPPSSDSAGWLEKLWPLVLGIGAARTATGVPAAPQGGMPAKVDPATGKPIPEATYVGPIDRGDLTVTKNQPPVQMDPRTGQPYVDPRAPKLDYVDPRMDPRGAAATSGATAPQARLADNISDLSRVPVNEPAPTTVTGDPALTEEAKKAQLQAEIDAENAASKRLQDQLMQRQLDQQRTQKLGAAAKAATGRR